MQIIKLDDTMIAIFGAISLFFTRTGKEKKEERFVLDWSDTNKMAWVILLVFGRGISLANPLEKVGIITQMGYWMSGLAGSGGFMLVLIIVLVSVFLSEVMRNVAQVIVFAPVVAGLADTLHINPLLLDIPIPLVQVAQGCWR